MAFSDYHTCDQCGERKTFYDAHMDPLWINDQWRYDYSASGIDGVPAYPGFRLYALCHECEKTHEIVIQPKAPTHDTRAALDELIASTADQYGDIKP
jgi:hypothetical protein